MRYVLFLVLLSPFSAALAQQQPAPQLIRISAGTGFVINRAGDIITNAHVVKACQSITVPNGPEQMPVNIAALDAEHDLAVLRRPHFNATYVAPLRWNIRELRVGDPVVVMGYPGAKGIQGQYVYKKTNVTNLAGPAGEPTWIQLESVAQHGNSGGPVLDTTGNVIAVIAGMANTYKLDKQTHKPMELVGQSDVAITLAALQVFLQKNQVAFFESSSGMVTYSDRQLEEHAREFIVPVRCLQGAVSAKDVDPAMVVPLSRR